MLLTLLASGKYTVWAWAFEYFLLLFTYFAKWWVREYAALCPHPERQKQTPLC